MQQKWHLKYSNLKHCNNKCNAGKSTVHNKLKLPLKHFNTRIRILLNYKPPHTSARAGMICFIAKKFEI